MTADPWSGTNYKGFSGVGRASPQGPGDPPRDPDGLHIDRRAERRFEPHEYRLRRPQRRGVPHGMLLAGIAVAVALGLLFGVLARPELAPTAPAPEPMEPVTTAAAEAAAPPVPVEVAAPVLPEAPEPAAPLEVLPPEMAEAAQARAPVRTAAPKPEPAVERRPDPPPQPKAAPRPEPPPVPQRVTRGPEPRPSFNCRYARSRSERMVCGDAELATLDRRLNRAFEEAVRSGIPYRELRAEQDDWLAIREDAARHSPAAVESVYRQRIRELNELAEPLG